MLNHRPTSSWLDVHASISAWIQEGNSRRLHPLELNRNWHPILQGSWMLRHTVDEASPLYGLLTCTEANEKLLALVVSIKGVDETYHGHLYENRVYYTNQIAFGKVFADMIEYDKNEIKFDTALISVTEEQSDKCDNVRKFHL
eukprot:TRINITY_DN8224_c0_g1_i10.p1 TRINITY_DN8224_c0_g1~~TRINITY_DN8224_c0_g1_i10.p1  ORF type:complete len:143 (-),score=6.41 TRINITY_DN8224_c0_g1_i10:102-530(-)